MFRLQAEKNKLTLLEREAMTSGSVNVYTVRFDFSAEWDGLTKTAVFKAAGVCGTRGGDIVLPTVWANLGTILEGAKPGPGSCPPTPDLWEQELDRKGDTLAYTGDGQLGLYSGDKLLSFVPVEGGGVSDHRLLSHREDAEQHPIEAVCGLEEITNLELLKIWNGG